MPAGAPRSAFSPRAGDAHEASHRGRWILIGAAVVVVLGGGISYLLWLNSKKIDPQQVKTSLRAEIDRVNELAIEKVIEKDELLHLILENELYAKYGGEAREQVRRSHDTLHAQAETEKKARNKVKAFLSRYAALKASPERLKEEASRFHDECRALRDQFGSTSYGPKLEEAVKELEGAMSSK